MTPESKIKREIVAYLDSLGERCWHVPYHNIGYGVAGVPDRLVCYRGYFLAIEIKRATGQPTPWQLRQIDLIMQAGGRAVVARSAEDVRRAIANIESDVCEHGACPTCCNECRR